ncbi:MAG: thiamine pyrophosphate-binding protein [bacterium]
MAKVFKGKRIFMESLVSHGVEFIFGNPGTTELPIIDSLGDYPQIRYILTLHEGVAVGAAHYYSQATGKPVVVNLHVGPGLGNGLGMLYNAYEGGTPMILTAGQQDSRLRLREPLLGHDLVAMAAPLTKWSVQAETADDLPLIMHRAFKVAQDPPSGPVFVALPLNVLEEETENPPLPPSRIFARSEPEPAGLRAAAELLAHAKRPVIVCGDGVGRAGAVAELVAVSELLGAPVWYEGLHHQINFPTAHPNCRDLMPGDYEGIRRRLGNPDTILLVGGDFFEELWHAPGSPFPEGAALIQMEESPAKLARNFSIEAALLAHPKPGLEGLHRALGETIDDEFRRAAAQRNQQLAKEKEEEKAKQKKRADQLWDNIPIAPSRLMAEIQSVITPDTVIVNESITASADLKRTIRFEGQGNYYGTRGGGIGQAMPGGIGAKLAHPDQPVLALSGDGSAMYTIQALWSAAHHRIPVVYIILHNRSYRILKINMNVYRQRFGLGGERAYPHMDLTDPDLDFVGIARGFGLQAQQIEDPNQIAPALKKALASGQPWLLDVLTDGTV